MFVILFKVDPKDLPDVNSVDKQYVYLVAKSDDGHFQFHKEAKILLSYRDGMVFIQTDKPVYTPRQSGKNCAPLTTPLVSRSSAKHFTSLIDSASLDPTGV